MCKYNFEFIQTILPQNPFKTLSNPLPYPLFHRRGEQLYLLGLTPHTFLSHTARSFTKLNFAFSSPPHPSPLLKERGIKLFLLPWEKVRMRGVT